MKYNELVIKKQKTAKRGGRGISAGHGKTVGRGTKGQGSRKSGGVRPGFEGGQMPLYMRLPKLRGFKSKKFPSENVYTSQLDSIKKTVIDTTVLSEAGLISNPYVPVKLLFDDNLKSKKTVNLTNASQKAIDAVAKAGGEFKQTARLGRTNTKKSED